MLMIDFNVVFVHSSLKLQHDCLNIVYMSLFSPKLRKKNHCTSQNVVHRNLPTASESLETSCMNRAELRIIIPVHVTLTGT